MVGRVKQAWTKLNNRPPHPRPLGAMPSAYVAHLPAWDSWIFHVQDLHHRFSFNIDRVNTQKKTRLHKLHILSTRRLVLTTSSPLAQEERQYAIKSFKSGAKDVMVASGVASKGLDFNEIQHVIIFSMPKEIEDYVHQIGRTGRSGKTGIATTFVNMNTPEQTLLDLKYLLMEAGQK